MKTKSHFAWLNNCYSGDLLHLIDQWFKIWISPKSLEKKQRFSSCVTAMNDRYIWHNFTSIYVNAECWIVNLRFFRILLNLNSYLNGKREKKNFLSLYLNVILKKKTKEKTVFKYMEFRISWNSRCVRISTPFRDYESEQLAPRLATNRSFTYQVTAWVISGHHLVTK